MSWLSLTTLKFPLLSPVDDKVFKNLGERTFILSSGFSPVFFTAFNRIVRLTVGLSPHSEAECRECLYHSKWTWCEVEGRVQARKLDSITSSFEPAADLALWSEDLYCQELAGDFFLFSAISTTKSISSHWQCRWEYKKKWEINEILSKPPIYFNK